MIWVLALFTMHFARKMAKICYISDSETSLFLRLSKSLLTVTEFKVQHRYSKFWADTVIYTDAKNPVAAKSAGISP